MIEDLIHDFRLLQKADSLIARFWLRVVARRLAASLFAGLIAIFGLGMANVAGFRALESSLGPISGARRRRCRRFRARRDRVGVGRQGKTRPRDRPRFRHSPDGGRGAANGHARAEDGRRIARFTNARDQGNGRRSGQQPHGGGGATASDTGGAVSSQGAAREEGAGHMRAASGAVSTDLRLKR